MADRGSDWRRTVEFWPLEILRKFINKFESFDHEIFIFIFIFIITKRMMIEEIGVDVKEGGGYSELFFFF